MASERPTVAGRVESSGRICCSKGHWVGALFGTTVQTYCRHCKTQVVVTLAPSECDAALLTVIKRLAAELRNE